MKIIEKNLFESIDGKRPVMIVNQCNCQNLMFEGFSREFYRHYPEIKKNYHDYCFKTPKEERLGTMTYVQLNPTTIGINLFVQYHYGDASKTNKIYTNVPLLIDRMKKLDTFARSKKAVLIAPIGIGCGKDGGDWEQIKAGLENTKIEFYRA